jgi:drug/metabolite transporter (DMT)-like permease
VLAAALWGLSTGGSKYALAGFGPLTLLVVELLAASAVLWVMLMLRGYRPPASWPLAATLGLLEPAAAYLGDTIGLARTSASNAALIFGMESAFVVVLAGLILGERIHRSLGLAVGAALLGLLVLEGTASLHAPGSGDLLVLSGTLSAAGYTVLARANADTLSSGDCLALTAHQFAFALLAIVPIAGIAWASGAEPVPARVAPGIWTAAVLVGIGGYGVSFVLYNYAITAIEAGPAAILINLIPAFGLVGAVCWLGESLSPQQLTGAALISCSVLVFSWQEFVLMPRPATETVAATISGWQLAQASSSPVPRSSPAG